MNSIPTPKTTSEVKMLMDEILQKAMGEVGLCMSNAGVAPLMAMVACGVVLETVLLCAAKIEPDAFEKAYIELKGKNKKHKPEASDIELPSKFDSWTLSERIAVAVKLKIIYRNGIQAAETVRDGRNRVHPSKLVELGGWPHPQEARYCSLQMYVVIGQIQWHWEERIKRLNQAGLSRTD